MATQDSITKSLHSCAQAFLSLADQLQTSTKYAIQVSPMEVRDQFDRLRLWAGNIGAHQKGTGSLDYRLRDAPDLKEETCDLLDSISESLAEASAIVTEKQVPSEEEDESGSEVDTGSLDPDEDTELKQLLASAKSTITLLMRLSIAIREPAPSSQLRAINKNHFHEKDEEHVMEKFPNSPSYLTRRLGRGITSRRQYLAYREKHFEKLSKGVEKLGLEESKTEATADQTEATLFQPNDRPLMIERDDEALSSTSYAPSTEEGTMRTPRLPREASEGQPYMCPLCHSLIAIYTKPAWKRHVFRDLHPYCCTFETCPLEEKIFVTRHEWFMHELEAHRSSYRCIEGCLRSFQNESAFEEHVSAKHTKLAAPDVLHLLKRTALTRASLDDKAICNLCGERMRVRKLRKHMGKHQEQLAMFALPINVDEESDVESDQPERDLCATDDNSSEEETSSEVSARAERSPRPTIYHPTSAAPEIIGRGEARERQRKEARRRQESIDRKHAKLQMVEENAKHVLFESSHGKSRASERANATFIAHEERRAEDRERLRQQKKYRDAQIAKEADAKEADGTEAAAIEAIWRKKPSRRDSVRKSAAHAAEQQRLLRAEAYQMEQERIRAEAVERDERMQHQQQAAYQQQSNDQVYVTEQPASELQQHPGYPRRNRQSSQSRPSLERTPSKPSDTPRQPPMSGDPRHVHYIAQELPTQTLIRARHNLPRLHQRKNQDVYDGDYETDSQDELYN